MNLQRPFARKVVLHCPGVVPANMSTIASQLLDDGTFVVAIVGPESPHIERMIDDEAVARGSPERNFILTTSHPPDALAEAIEYARWFEDDGATEPQVVVLQS